MKPPGFVRLSGGRGRAVSHSADVRVRACIRRNFVILILFLGICVVTLAAVVTPAILHQMGPSAQHSGFWTGASWFLACIPHKTHNSAQYLQWLEDAQSNITGPRHTSPNYSHSVSPSDSPLSRLPSTTPLRDPPVRVYVYDTPRQFTQELLDQPVDLARASMEDLQRLPSGGLELAFHKFLLERPPAGSGGAEGLVRTREPGEADLFFVPFYGSNSIKTKRLAKAGLYDALIRWLRSTGPWWDRVGGADHVLAMGRHMTAKNTAYGRSSLALAFEGSPSGPRGLSVGPALLLFEFTNYSPSHMLRHLWAYTRHVVIPRPDPFTSTLRAPPPELPRPVQMAYVGSQITIFRKNLLNAMQSLERDSGAAVYMDAFCSDVRLQRAEAMQEGGDVAHRDGLALDVSHVYRFTDFCPCPRGDARSDSRFYDAIRAGCIPVVFDRLRMSAFESFIDYEAFVITVDEPLDSEGSLRRVLHQLKQMPLEEKVRRRAAMAEAVEWLAYNSSATANAFVATMSEVASKVRLVRPYRRQYGHFEKGTHHKTQSIAVLQYLPHWMQVLSAEIVKIVQDTLRINIWD